MTTGYTAISFLKTNHSSTKEATILLENHYYKVECCSCWHKIKKHDGNGYKFVHLHFRIKFPAFFRTEYSKEIWMLAANPGLK